MAFTIPAAGAWPAPDPLDYAPAPGVRQRSVVADDISGDDGGTSSLARCVNYALARLAKRDCAMLFAQDASWTDAGAYVAANKVVWRQPISPGLIDVDYRVRCQITGAGANTGKLRIQGADGVNVEVAVNAGGWQDVVVPNVDLAAAAPAAFFTPILQGYVDAAGDTLDVRTVSWREDDLAAIPAGGLDSAGAVGADDGVTFDPDAPLSADAVEELARAMAWHLDRRTATLCVVLMLDGTGAHPTTVWTSSAAAHPSPVDGAGSNVFWRDVVLPDWHLPRDVVVMAEAKSNGAATGTLLVRDRHGNGTGATLAWNAGENVYSWKTATMARVPVRQEGPDGWGTEMFASIIASLTVRCLVLYAGDASFAW